MSPERTNSLITCLFERCGEIDETGKGQKVVKRMIYHAIEYSLEHVPTRQVYSVFFKENLAKDFGAGEDASFEDYQ